MHLRTFFVLFLFTFCAGMHLLAQSPLPDSLPKLKLCEISISAFDNENFVHENDAPLALSTFKLLAPRSVLLNSDFSGYTYTSNNGLTSQLGGHGMYAVSAAFHLRDKTHLAYRPNCKLRFNLGFYVKGALLSGTFQKTADELPYDTVPSSSSSGPTYRFYTNTTQVEMKYHAKQVMPECAFIYMFNPDGRWDLQVGFGMGGNIGFDATTNIHYENFNFLNAYNASGELLYTFYPYYLTDSGLFPGLETTEVDEQVKRKNNYGMTAYIPVILNFQWGKKRAFWQHIYSAMEVDLGAGFSFVPETETYFYRVTRIGFVMSYSLD